MRGAKVYRNVSLETASPVRILDELFAELLRDIDSAENFIRQRDFAKKGDAIVHALAIVNELTVALDHAAAPDLCSRLAGLYQFVYTSLMQANVKANADSLPAVRKVVNILRDAFQRATESSL